MRRIAEAAVKTPLLDRTNMKSGVEYKAVKYAQEVAGLPIKGKIPVSTMTGSMGEALEMAR